jgi:hypothetical protein
MKETTKEIHKKKLMRLIAQGEAKNTKHILAMPEVKDGIKEILGDQRGEELLQTLDRIVKAADKLDWVLPPQMRGAGMDQSDAFGGAVDIDWE